MELGRYRTIEQALNGDKIVSIAHRGASANAPENTLPAFQLAIEQGVDLLELDVKLTKDGQAVVIHDDRVDRTSNGSGRVSEMTYAELAALEYGSWFSSDYCGVTIPTLTQVLELAKGRCLLDIELKLDREAYRSEQDFYSTLGVEVLSLVDHFKMGEQVMLSSFNFPTLASVKHHRPDIKCGLAISPQDLRESATQAASCGMEVIFPQVHSGKPEYISFAHSLNLAVFICVFDANIAVIDELLTAGVDGIMGNQVDSLLKIISAYQRKQEG